MTKLQELKAALDASNAAWEAAAAWHAVLAAYVARAASDAELKKEQTND